MMAKNDADLWNRYYPSYVGNLGLPRTLSHVVATASVINVLLRLSKKPLI